MTVAISIIIFALFMVALSYTPQARRDRALFRRLEHDRSKLTDRDFHDQFFEDTAIPLHVVSKVREVFSEELGMDLRGLEPDDDLSTEYSALWGLDSLADVNIVVALEDHYDISISNGEAEKLRSVRDVCQIVAAKLENKTNAEQGVAPNP